MAGGFYALVTGASSGIGECFARALAARGQSLVLVARSGDKLRALAGELRAQYAIGLEPLEADLSAEGAPRRLAATLRERKLGIDMLINNAGFGAQGEFWKLPLDRLTQMLKLNVQALVELTHLLLPAMVERRRGAIINVSSTASFQPVPYTSVYSASKAFVTSFSLALAEELRDTGVKVVTLCPGGTATNFFEASQYTKRKFPSMHSPKSVVAVGLKALERGGGLTIPGVLNKLGVASQRLAPRGVVVRAAAAMFRPGAR